MFNGCFRFKFGVEFNRYALAVLEDIQNLSSRFPAKLHFLHSLSSSDQGTSKLQALSIQTQTDQ
jgi:hypothetical protein